MQVKNKASTLLMCFCISTTASAGFGDLFGKKEKKEEVKPPEWVSEPLLTDEKCDNIKVDTVSSFINKFKTPYLVKDSLDAAAKKAKNNYTLAAAVSNRALLCTAESLSLKETIKQLNLERDILLSGTSLSSNELKKQRSYSDAANKEIEATLAKTEKVKPEQKKTMMLSFSMLLAGGYLTYETKEKLQKYQEEIKNEAQSSKSKLSGGDIFGGAASLIKGLGSGADVGSLYLAAVDNGVTLGKTAASYRKFLESNDIPVPESATQYYGKVLGSDW